MKRVLSILLIAALIAIMIPIVGAKAYAASNSCPNCGSTDVYSWDESRDDYSSTQHVVEREYHCYNCSNIWTEKAYENHVWSDIDSSVCIKQATVTSNGIVERTCYDCGKTIKQSVTWKYGTDYSYDYGGSLEWWCVYNKAKKVSVDFRAPKGAKIKVRIGGKTYTKKVTGKKKTTFKLKKKAKYGKKFTIKVYYNGKLIASDWDYVWYASKLKRGFTKNQARWTWGKPDSKSSSSGGWSYWYYDDGSEIYFKNGRIKYWYNATD